MKKISTGDFCAVVENDTILFVIKNYAKYSNVKVELVHKTLEPRIKNEILLEKSICEQAEITIPAKANYFGLQLTYQTKDNKEITKITEHFKL